MSNPWKDIKLSDYEGHMNLESVKQLPVLRLILKSQLESYPVDSAMIIGVAGGAGLEHIQPGQLKKLYGVDINEEFLKECDFRYANLKPMLELINCDLMDENCSLPTADMMICNLVAEYIGYDSVLNTIEKVTPKYVSYVIQVNMNNNFVSDSPYLKAFVRLDEVHCLMEEEVLSEKMDSIGFQLINKGIEDLPNGKLLIRLDFQRK
ncbi:MAG: methyltransferase type 11 [Firmicutes bacterium]|nr:methyltransferase type 11 [Bacillota bacterium]